jgi:hypothetical protein
MDPIVSAAPRKMRTDCAGFCDTFSRNVRNQQRNAHYRLRKRKQTDLPVENLPTLGQRCLSEPHSPVGSPVQLLVLLCLFVELGVDLSDLFSYSFACGESSGWAVSSAGKPSSAGILTPGSIVCGPRKPRCSSGLSPGVNSRFANKPSPSTDMLPRISIPEDSTFGK